MSDTQLVILFVGLIIAIVIVVNLTDGDKGECEAVDASGTVYCHKPRGHDRSHEGDWMVGGVCWGYLIWQ